MFAPGMLSTVGICLNVIPPRLFSGGGGLISTPAVLPSAIPMWQLSLTSPLGKTLKLVFTHFKQCDTMYFIIKRPLNSSLLKGECYWNTNSLKWHICMHHYVFKKNCPLHICLLCTNFFPKCKAKLSPWKFSCLLDSWRSITNYFRNLWIRNHTLF